ncbi:MAG: DUF4960 domain-containing protein, partial [Lewinella sp.]|nr:DUF4960 domain-containing protein [Lewinella sp.]
MKKFLFFSLVLTLGLAWTGCNKDDDNKPSGGDTQITLLKFNSPFAAVGTIDQTAKTVVVPVPFAADVSAVTGEVLVSTDATVSPDLKTPVDFSGGPVTFTVTNGDNTSTYQVSVQFGENPLRLVLVGDPVNFNDLDPEIKTAYQWALDKYKEKASYIPFSEITPSAIETAEMVWFHYTTFPRPDIDNGAPIFPASATGSAKDVITNFYKGGGSLLLTGLAGSYVAQVGRVDAAFGPTNFDIGGDEYIENPDNWGISFKTNIFNSDDYPAGNDDFYLFKNLTTAPVTFEGVTYDAIFLSDGGAKKNRAHIWDFNRFYGDDLPGGCDAPNAKKTQFEADTNSKVRASFEWDPAACGV